MILVFDIPFQLIVIFLNFSVIYKKSYFAIDLIANTYSNKDTHSEKYGNLSSNMQSYIKYPQKSNHETVTDKCE